MSKEAHDLVVKLSAAINTDSSKDAVALALLLVDHCVAIAENFVVVQRKQAEALMFIAKALERIANVHGAR